MIAALICVLLSGDAKAATPVQSWDGIRFARDKSARHIPFELIGNHIYVRATVNGSRALWFLLDTGATRSYLDAEGARALRLKADVDSVSLDLPGVHISRQLFAFVPLTFGIYDGHQVDGLLGYDFLRRFVVGIDYARRQLTLIEPESYTYAGDSPILPLTLLEDDSGGKVPLVRVWIEFRDGRSVQGQFIADTGARGALSFNSPFAREQRAIASLPGAVRMVVGGGAMVRDTKLALGRVRSIQLTGLALVDPIVGVSEDTTGVLASPEFDGVLGGEVLRRFRVIFDFSRSRAIFEKTSAVGEPFEADMSGVFLIAQGPKYQILRVRSVVAGSPGAEAGLREGDLLEAVDGRPVSQLRLEDVRRMFRESGGAHLLQIRRGAASQKVTLRLKRLV